MPEKDRRTISIDNHLNEELKNEDVNASGLINRLLSEYFASGLSQEAALRVKLADLQQQRERAKSKERLAASEVGQLDDEIEVVKDELNNLDRQEVEEIETVVNLIKAEQEGISRKQLSTDNPMIQHRAEKCGMTPERFINDVKDRL